MEGYGHSMIRRAYFLMMLSSANMKSDLLTVRQFCRWGTGLYRAMVRARCALACFIEAVSCAAAASWPSPLPPRSKSPSPASAVSGADSSPNRAILQRDEETTRLRQCVFCFYSYYTKIKKCDVKKRSTFNPVRAFLTPRIPSQKSCRFLSLHIHEKQMVISFSWIIF